MKTSKKLLTIIMCLAVLIGALAVSGIAASAADAQLATPKITGCESLDSGVVIKWDPVEGAQKYRVYYKGKNGWTKMGESTGTSFVDTDVSSGTTYTYTVRCIKADLSAFTSDYDRVGYAYTYNMATPQITGFESTSKGVSIKWDPVPNASKYRVYYKGRNGWTKMVETDKTSYLDSDVSYGTTYTYTVRCVNAAGNRFTSDFNSSGWKHTYYLKTPRITDFNSTAKGVKITWGKVAGAEKYRVYYYGSKGWTKMGESTGTSFVDDDVRAGSTYRYTVRCINSSLTKFTSDCNTTGWRYKYDPQLDTPRITSIEPEENGLNIKWTAVNGADLYRVYYKGSNGWTRMAEVRGTSYLDTDVSSSHQYTYTVRCLGCKGKDFASGYDKTGSSFYYYSNPTVVTTTRANGIELNVKASNCPNVRVYRKTSSGWKRLGEVNTGKNELFIDTDVQPGKTYVYTARCLSNDGSTFLSLYNTSGYSHTYSVSSYLPEFETVMYAGKNKLLLQAKANKFGITDYRLDIRYGDTSYGAQLFIDSKAHYIRTADIVDNAKLYLSLAGLNKNGDIITDFNYFAHVAYLIKAPDQFVAQKIGDRKYRFSWNNYAHADYDTFNLVSEDGKYVIDSKSLKSKRYDVDLSAYPKDTVWTAKVWSSLSGEVCDSATTTFKFRESDYQ